MKLLDSHNPISSDDLKVVENKIGFELPAEYKLFLLENNGGRPSLDGVRHNDEHFDFVGYFYAVLDESRHDDLVRQITEHIGMIPQGYLPFADSPGGDAFCISLKDHEYGYIYHWDHEEANYDGEPWEYNMTQLSESLKLFLGNLCVGE